MNNFEIVSGLEIHVELKTRTKLFCACRTDYGAAPNSQICPVCMGYPGTLPVLNREAVRLAVTAGLALGCKIHEYSRFDRKNYFYPDLPKGYQITQFFHPICTGGHLKIMGKDIRITRIHIEEDAGKLLHDPGGDTRIDCNRCGIPLIEIVTEPDFSAASEVREFLMKLRSALLFAGVSDCRMNEGSLRCDVNLSLHRHGETPGTRTEIKNLNSFRFVEKAFTSEAARQEKILREGGSILRETRRFDEKTGETHTMRSKETTADYRYFPEPDLPPLILCEKDTETICHALPKLPEERKQTLLAYGISSSNADKLLTEPAFADRFDAAAAEVSDRKLLASLTVSCLTVSDHVSPSRLAEVSRMAETGEISLTVAKKLLQRLTVHDFDPADAVKAEGLAQISDPAILTPLIRQVIDGDPKGIIAFRSGKANVLQSFVGRVMGMTEGKGNPAVISEIAARLLAKLE